MDQNTITEVNDEEMSPKEQRWKQAQIEQFIESLLKEIGEVDAMFKNYATTFLDEAKRIEKTMSDKDSDEEMEEKAFAAGTAYLAGKAVEGAGNIINAVQSESKLNQILEAKRNIAAEKQPFIAQHIQTSEKMSELQRKVFLSYANTANLQTGRLDKIKPLYLGVLRRYRRNLHNTCYLYYLQEQFKAWMNGMHDAENTSFPTMESVNMDILTYDLYPAGKEEQQTALPPKLEKIIGDISDGKLSSIDGRLFYVISDRQLLATCLAHYQDPATWLEHKDNVNPVLREQIFENPSFDKVCLHYELRQENEDGYNFRCALYILNLLLCVVAVTLELVYFVNLGTLWKWVVGIVLFYLIYKKTMSVIGQLTQVYDLKNSLINLFIQNKLRKEAGYQPQKITATSIIQKNNKTIIYAIIGGLIGFLFVPIPGGLITCALIGAGLASSNKNNQEEETDGSDYAEIHLGKWWKAFFLFVILAGTICYQIIVI